MLKRCKESKVMRDPIHGYIHVDYQVVWDCINAKEFQRLRRIHQLGGNFQVYHTAEHSRFSHSLGVYEIVKRMVDEGEGLKDSLSEYDKVCVMLAGLLHDIGHCPFSHAFESIANCKHEVFTQRIILEDTQLHQILSNVNASLPKDVADIIMYQHPNVLLNQIVSGQLDADRMDYLLRDAYFTGTTYGNFDLERVLRTIRVKDNKIVVKESGIHSVEDYIMARYHMYWQVYYHPIARSYEAILTLLFKRLKDIFEQDPSRLKGVEMFFPFLKDEPAKVQDHYLLDEATAQYGFHFLNNHEDKILSDLSKRLLERKLFDYETITSSYDVIEIKKAISKRSYDVNYYFYQDHATQRPYRPYNSQEGHNIWILNNNDEVVELSQISMIVQAIVMGKTKEDNKVFFPALNDES
ncbi:MAG: HD domain-containing protein [Erysipelotrichaceae bacterium]